MIYVSGYADNANAQELLAARLLPSRASASDVLPPSGPRAGQLFGRESGGPR